MTVSQQTQSIDYYTPKNFTNVSLVDVSELFALYKPAIKYVIKPTLHRSVIKIRSNFYFKPFQSHITPFKKSNATRLWSIIFLLSWICIHQVSYPCKACSFAFRLIPYLLGLCHWGVCRVSKLGAMSKRKSYKIDRIVWDMHAMSCFVLSFCHVCERMHAYPLSIHCTEILRNKNIMLNFKKWCNFGTFTFWHCV